MIRINKHAELNGKFLKDAKALLEKRDYVQTSEKLWGASAQIVKATPLKSRVTGRCMPKNNLFSPRIAKVGLKWGKRLQSHEAINKYIVELSKELHDKSILVDFSVANSLHQNFYENWLAPETVIQDAKVVGKLIKKLSSLVN